MARKQNATVLLSGGIDSSTCVEFYQRQNFKVDSLFIDYGQPAALFEKKASKKISNHYGIDLTIISVKSKVKFKSGEIIGRNLFLLSNALMQFKYKKGFIVIGIHDGTTYPDCTKKFIDDVQKVFDLYKNGSIMIGAPFASFKKVEIYSYAKENNVPLSLTYSCEKGKKQPCGKCLSCKDLENLYGSKKQ